MGASTIRTLGHFGSPTFAICALKPPLPNARRKRCVRTLKIKCQEKDHHFSCPCFLSWLPPLLAISDSQFIASVVFIIIIIVMITTLLLIICFHLAPTHTLHLQQTSHLFLKNPDSLNPFTFTYTFPSDYTSCLKNTTLPRCS